VPARRITGLREQARGKVLVEVDGTAWRAFPPEVVARAGLRAGAELDRPLLRVLARERRRSRALMLAARALRRRDLSTTRLGERLRHAGVPAASRSEALEVLRRSGFLDDDRFAAARARALAERNMGDAAIRFDLERHGIEPEGIDRAFAEVAGESERAARIAETRGRSPATARYLARRGFCSDVVGDAVGFEVAREG
jgi:regulatory protein